MFGKFLCDCLGLDYVPLCCLFRPGFMAQYGMLYLWFKYDRQKYYAWRVRPDRGSNSWPPDHASIFHVTETPALTTRPSMTSILAKVYVQGVCLFRSRFMNSIFVWFTMYICKCSCSITTCSAETKLTEASFSPEDVLDEVFDDIASESAKQLMDSITPEVFFLQCNFVYALDWNGFWSGLWITQAAEQPYRVWKIDCK